MIKVKYFNLSVAGTAERFILMMAGTIIFGFLSQFILGTIWGFALAVSFILGISFKIGDEKVIEKKEGKILPMDMERTLEKTA